MGSSAPRRRSFEARLKRNAREWGAALSETYAFHFRRRYSLPPTDPRFLNATMEEIVVDWHAHRFFDDPKLREQEVADPDFEARLAAMEAEMLAAAEAASPQALPAPAEEAEGAEEPEAAVVPVVQAVEPLALPPPEPPEDDWEIIADDNFQS